MRLLFLDFYIGSLTIEQSNDPSLDSQWVSLPVSSLDIRSYVLSNSQDAASRFYLVKYNATNTWELHAAEDGDRQVVLHGRNQSSELLYMSDVLHPGSADVLEGELAEWGVFILDNNVLDVKDGSALTERSFVAVHPEVEDDYSEIALYDGKCCNSGGRA